MFPHPCGVWLVAEMKTSCWSWLCIPQPLLQPPTDGLELLLPARQPSCAAGRSSVPGAAGAGAGPGAAPGVSFRVPVTRTARVLCVQPGAVSSRCRSLAPQPRLALRFHSRPPEQR